MNTIKELTREEIKQNRLKFAAGLQEEHREKTTAKLENVEFPNQRCCLGHGCDIFGVTRKVVDNTVLYGEEHNTNVAPSELIELLGLGDDCGVIKEDEHGFILESLTMLNDQTSTSIQEIGKLIEGWVEGGEGTPFIPLSDYKE